MVSLWPLWGCARKALRQMANFQVLRSVTFSPYIVNMLSGQNMWSKYSKQVVLYPVPMPKMTFEAQYFFLHTWSEANVDEDSANLECGDPSGDHSWQDFSKFRWFYRLRMVGSSVFCSMSWATKWDEVKFPSVSWCEVRSNPLSRSDPTPSSHEKNQ